MTCSTIQSFDFGHLGESIKKRACTRDLRSSMDQRTVSPARIGLIRQNLPAHDFLQVHLAERRLGLMLDRFKLGHVRDETPCEVSAVTPVVTP